MYQTILFKVPGRPSTLPLVILTGPAIGAQYSTTHFPGVAKMLSRTLSKAGEWMRCKCTPLRMARALFSVKTSLAMAALAVSAMWWHSGSIADPLQLQRAVGFDCLVLLPWALVWTIRLTLSVQKGGEL